MTKLLLPEQLSLRQYMTLAWDFLGHGTWGPPDPPQIYAAEAMIDEENDRLIWEGFRGMAKSTTAAVVCGYAWLQDPYLQILVYSANQDKADEFTNQVWKLLHGMPIFEHLRPRKDDRARLSGFDLGIGSTEQSKSMISVGIDSQVVGKRADWIICDDIEVPKNSETQGMREKLRKRVGDFHYLLKRPGPQRILMLGTPHTEASIYTWLRDTKGYRVMLWPIRYPNADRRAYYGEALHWRLRADMAKDPSLEGKPTEPHRFPEDVILRLEAESNTPADRARQLYLDPRVGDLEKYPLKINDLMVMDLSAQHGPKQPIYSRLRPIKGVELFNVGFDGDRFHHPVNMDEMVFEPYQDVKMFVDPSGSGADETAYIITGWLNGFLNILDWGGNTMWGDAVDGYSDKTMAELCDRALAHGAKAIVVEENYGSGMFGSLLQKHIRETGKKIGVDAVKVKGRKEQRILQNIRPLLAQNRIVLNLRLIEADYRSGDGRGRESYRAIYQLAHFTDEKGALEHDDRLDALALACEFYHEQASIDVDMVLAKEREAELKELARGMAFPLGSIPKPPNGLQPRRGATNPLLKNNRRGGARRGYDGLRPGKFNPRTL